MKHAGIPILLMVFYLVAGVSAEEWAIIGARNLGMGGTGVACAKGAAAYYWNPALYAVKDRNDMFLPVGIGLAVEGDLVDKADFLSNRIKEIDLDALQDKFNTAPGTITETDFHDAFELLLIDIPLLSEYGSGITTTATMGLTSRWGNYGVSLLGLGYGGAHPEVNLAANGGVGLSDDTISLILFLGNPNIPSYGNRMGDLTTAEAQNLAAQIDGMYAGIGIDTASTFVYLAQETPANSRGETVDFTNPSTVANLLAIAEATFGNDAGAGGTPGSYDVMLDNLSGMDIGLVYTQEIGFTYARAPMENLALGANIKGVIAETYITRVVVSELDDGETIAGQVTDFSYDPVTSRRLAVDMGALYSLTEELQLGLTVRNFNQPTFSFEGDSNGFTLYSQTRGGILWQATDTFALAADLDLFPNLSEVLPGLKTQFLATGMEWTPCDWWAFRAGIYKNIAIPEEGLVYTMGMGFAIGKFYLDLAGSLGFSDVKVETAEIGMDVYVPERGNFMISMGLDLTF